MCRSRIPPRPEMRSRALVETHRGPSASKRKLMASNSGPLQSTTMSKISHSEQLVSEEQPEGWVRISRTSR